MRTGKNKWKIACNYQFHKDCESEFLVWFKFRYPIIVLVLPFLLGAFPGLYGQELYCKPKSEILKDKLSFRGDNYYEMGEFKVDSSYSFSLWFNSNDLLSGITTLADIGDKYHLRTATNRQLWLGQHGKKQIKTTSLRLAQNVWYQVVVVIDFPSARMYLNGNEIAAFILKADFIQQDCIIGLGKNRNREFFRGDMTGFRFFDNALNNIEVKTLFETETEPCNLSENVLAFLSMDNKKVRGSFTGNAAFSSVNYIHDQQRGKVAKFERSSYIDFGEVEFDNVITIAGWVKQKEQVRQALVSSGHNFAFRINMHGKLFFTIPSVVNIRDSSILLKPDIWYHVAITYAEQQKVCFYVNGKKIKEVEVSASMQSSSKKLRIGNNIWNDHYLGLMDDLVVWTRILNDEEILRVSQMSSRELKAEMPKAKLNLKWEITFVLFLLIALGLWSIYKSRRKKTREKHKQKSVSAFEQKVEEVTSLHLSDSEYDVEKLTELMGMSRSALYKQMKSELGKPPKEYIRERRLISAAKLLREGSENISEIIFTHGFESRAYFNKCFKEKFGMTPSEYRNKNIT